MWVVPFRESSVMMLLLLAFGAGILVGQGLVVALTKATVSHNSTGGVLVLGIMGLSLVAVLTALPLIWGAS